MLIAFPPEISDKIEYINGQLSPTTELTEEEQVIFDELVIREKESYESQFEEIE